MESFDNSFPMLYKIFSGLGTFFHYDDKFRDILRVIAVPCLSLQVSFVDAKKRNKEKRMQKQENFSFDVVKLDQERDILRMWLNNSGECYFLQSQILGPFFLEFEIKQETFRSASNTKLKKRPLLNARQRHLLKIGTDFQISNGPQKLLSIGDVEQLIEHFFAGDRNKLQRETHYVWLRSITPNEQPFNPKFSTQKSKPKLSTKKVTMPDEPLPQKEHRKPLKRKQPSTQKQSKTEINEEETLRPRLLLDCYYDDSLEEICIDEEAEETEQTEPNLNDREQTLDDLLQNPSIDSETQDAIVKMIGVKKIIDELFAGPPKVSLSVEDNSRELQLIEFMENIAELPKFAQKLAFEKKFPKESFEEWQDIHSCDGSITASSLGSTDSEDYDEWDEAHGDIQEEKTDDCHDLDDNDD